MPQLLSPWVGIVQGKALQSPRSGGSLQQSPREPPPTCVPRALHRHLAWETSRARSEGLGRALVPCKVFPADPLSPGSRREKSRPDYLGLELFLLPGLRERQESSACVVAATRERGTTLRRPASRGLIQTAEHESSLWHSILHFKE